jgi:hypothetical protein
MMAGEPRQRPKIVVEWFDPDEIPANAAMLPLSPRSRG